MNHSWVCTKLTLLWIWISLKMQLRWNDVQLNFVYRHNNGMQYKYIDTPPASEHISKGSRTHVHTRINLSILIHSPRRWMWCGRDAFVASVTLRTINQHSFIESNRRNVQGDRERECVCWCVIDDDCNGGDNDGSDGTMMAVLVNGWEWCCIDELIDHNDVVCVCELILH